MCDIVWSDPDTHQPGWSLSCRGISFSFDETVVEQFWQKHGIDLIVRAHQITGDMVRGGHRIFAGGRLATIFSAPNYQNMLNDGCVLRVKKNDKNFAVNFFIFRPVARRSAIQRRSIGRGYTVQCGS
ncbi:hypothetical protein Q1695_009317 [Nippostrongylus brasiliensis]|nr:hypothetical protein Q1695_009317 [Nippostrongylus brasiliensis]